jgi:glycosyltransferase involved in cell wall biosynthesis
MIRILEFADVINKADFIDTIIQNADRTQFEVSVCVRSEDHNIARPEVPADVKYRFLAGNSRKDAVKTAWKLSRLLKEWKIDILHAHHFEQAIVGYLATRFYRKTKLVIGRHYSDAIYRQPSALKRKGLLGIERLTNHAASRIIVPSKFIFDILIRQGVSADKIDTVLYGFDPAKYTAVSEEDVRAVREEFGIEEKIAFANFGRLHEEKGQRYLITAAAELIGRVPNAHILIVGEGSERKALEKQIAEHGLSDNVRLVGWRKDAMTIMAAVDAVVQSTLQEAFSQVMCEALWMARPLVISDVSGAVDIINETNGIMIPKADPAALCDAMERLAKDPDLRRSLGENGKQFVAGELTIDKMIGQYEGAFRKAMYD